MKLFLFLLFTNAFLFMFVHGQAIRNPCLDVCECSIDTIDCTSVKLTAMPNGTGFAEELVSNNGQYLYLSLKDNQISSLPIGFFDVDFASKFNRIDFDGNNLEELKSGMFTGLSLLDILYLSNNDIYTIGKETFIDLKRLDKLNLDGNIIPVIYGNTFIGLKMLKRLSLRSNKIELMAKKGFVGLDSLEILALGRNRLSTISVGTFENLNQLRELILESNRLTEIYNGMFIGLNKLEMLRLDANSIEKINEDGFAGLDSLRDLTIRQNKLGREYDINVGTFGNLYQLQHLDLSQNELKRIGKWLTNRTLIIQTLHVQNNEISEIDKNAFNGLRSLENLDLNNNFLSYIEPETFRNLRNLRQLSMSSNRFENVTTEMFIGLSGLRELRLSQNNISYIQPSSFDLLVELQNLNLDENRLYTLPGSVFSQLSSLVILVLDKNPWNCTCENLYDYQQWLLSANKTNAQQYDLNCIQPSILKLSLLPCSAPTILLNEDCVFKVYMGEQYVFECEAIGFPEPEVNWEISRQTDSGSYEIVSGKKENRLSKVRTGKIGQNHPKFLYNCKANNFVGRDTKSCIISIISPNALAIWLVVSFIIIFYIGLFLVWCRLQCKEMHKRRSIASIIIIDY